MKAHPLKAGRRPVTGPKGVAPLNEVAEACKRHLSASGLLILAKSARKKGAE